MLNPIIICPYIDENSIINLRNRLGHRLPVHFWQDQGRIGSDLAYQYLWNFHKDRDIIILHSDMLPMPGDTSNLWYAMLLEQVKMSAQTDGMFGMKLLYPAQSTNNKWFIQHAGGRFTTDGEPCHFGVTTPRENSTTSGKYEPEEDNGQYDRLREVSWVTFGGLYIRRSVISAVGDFDPRFFWTYFRDVDYCLSAREAGFRICQTSLPFLHAESQDNKILQQQNPTLARKWGINRQIFFEKWSKDKLITIDKDITL